MTWGEHYHNRTSFGNHLNWNYVRHLLAEVVMAAERGPVLEVGVGTGYMSIWLSLQGLAATGVDNDAQILRDAELANMVLGGTATFMWCDAHRLTEIFEPFQFGVAFSQGLLEHFSNEEIREVLNQQLRVAKRVVFSVPSCYWMVQDFGDERLLSLEDWAGIVQPLDGKVQMLEYCGTFEMKGREHVIGMLEGGPSPQPSPRGRGGMK